MLILTRKLSETIVIGDDIRVTVLDVKGHQVRLGIGAPDNVEIHREEIYNRIKQERTALKGNRNEERSNESREEEADHRD